MSYEELTAELTVLKKRLYTFKLQGIELHQRARNHVSSHRMAALHGHGSTDEEHEKDADMKFKAFGPHPQQNPLSNEYILEMIAFHLPLKDLQNCKRVCRLWALECGRWEMKRKSIVVVSDDDSEAVELVKQKREGNLISLSTLVILSSALETRAVSLVVDNFGSTLSSLRLDECTMTAAGLYNVLRGLPCLDHLSLKTNDMIRRRNAVPLSPISPLDQITSDSFTPTLVLHYLRELSWEDERAIRGLERLPSMCPNLIAIQISNLGHCQPERFRGLRWKSLKALDVQLQQSRGDSQVNYFRSFAMMRLSLRKICLKNVDPEDRADNCGITMYYLNKFLQGSKNSLEGLKITRPIRLRPRNVVLPFFPGDSPLPVYMPVLKSLTIDMEFLTSLNVVDHLPSLEKLTCCKNGYWLNWWKVLRVLPKVHSSISELTVGAIDAECLKKIMISLPQITTLDIAEDRVNDKLFSTICATLSKLEVLRIRKTASINVPHLSLTDVGITGIPLDVYGESDEGVFVTENVESLRMYPNIRNLKDLQILDINCAPSLSDVSLVHGFVGMPSLIMVHLPKCKISDASLQRFPNLLVSNNPDMDGGRRIRISKVNPSLRIGGLNTLLKMVPHTAIVENPLSLFGEMVVERAELSRFHD